VTPPRRSLLTTTLLLLPLQIVFRSVEALLPLVVALYFGRSAATDVYTFEWALFALAGSLVFSAFQDSAVVPILAELKLRDPGHLPAVRGSLLAHTVAIGAAVGFAFGILACGWFALRFTGSARDAALLMAPPFAFYLVALGTKTFFASILNAEHFYVPLPIASALGAVVSIAVIALGHRTLSIVSVPCGSLAGELVAVAVLAAAARAAGVRIAPNFARPEPVQRVARLVASEVGGSAVVRVNPVVDQLAATLLGFVGGGTLLKLSADVATVPTSLLQAALLPVLLTHLSDDFAARDHSKLRSSVRRALAVVVALLSTSTVALWAVGPPLLRLVFAHGAMDDSGVEKMAHIFPYHLVGLAPFGALLVLARAHVAAQNSRIMVSMGLINAGLNAFLNLALAPVLGVEGIALSTSCTSAIVALVFAIRFEAHLSALANTQPEST
jgi:putative peptidoglycan lipid II flippase